MRQVALSTDRRSQALADMLCNTLFRCARALLPHDTTPHRNDAQASCVSGPHGSQHKLLWVRLAGLNVARMAELPEAVVLRAGARAAAMEADTVRRLNRRGSCMLENLSFPRSLSGLLLYVRASIGRSPLSQDTDSCQCPVSQAVSVRTGRTSTCNKIGASYLLIDMKGMFHLVQSSQSIGSQAEKLLTRFNRELSIDVGQGLFYS